MNILDVCATRTLDCGVVPIELGVRAMYDCYSSRVAGYRIRAYINSILYGSLSPEDYFASIEHDAVGADFAKRNLRAVIKAAPGISGEAPEPEIISVQCPQAILEGEGIYDILRAVGRGADAKIIKKMCLEFDGNLLCGDVRRLERIFADIRAAGWKIAVGGYGQRSFPMAALADVPPDVVYMSAETVAMLSDREKAASARAFIRFATGLGIKVVAEGVTDDGQLRDLGSSECFAYMPSTEYMGNRDCPGEERDLSSFSRNAGGDGNEL